jgi:hypothetical protein
MSNAYELYAGIAKVTEGSFDQVGAYLKHHVDDGHYTIVGESLWMDCCRTDGVVEPNEEGIVAALPPHLIREMKRNRGLQRFPKM